MIHPAALGGCLQLAVIAAHNGNVKEIVKAYLPTIIESLTVWQTPDSIPLPEKDILKSHGVCRGMRSARGTSDLYNSDGRQLAQLTVSLYSLEGGFGNRQDEKARQPYTRLVWQPDIIRLHREPIRKLYPSGASDSYWAALSDHLDEPDELLVLDAYTLLPSAVEIQHQPIHIKKYVDFLTQKRKTLSGSPRVSKLSPSMRQQRILELVEKCRGHVPSADLIA